MNPCLVQLNSYVIIMNEKRYYINWILSLLQTLQTDRAAMLDEILDYVKFLRLQVKVCFFKCSVVFNIIATLIIQCLLSI
jgi:hypothetical protein